MPFESMPSRFFAPPFIVQNDEIGAQIACDHNRRSLSPPSFPPPP
ncbi:hypothetical protein GGQ10_000940 [Salinibacter ruber]|nr:hypothetical protein [Salinibacter ruber]